MQTINCYIPLKLRLRGEPGEDDWENLEEVLVVQYSRMLKRSIAELTRSQFIEPGMLETMAEPFAPERVGQVGVKQLRPRKGVSQKSSVHKLKADHGSRPRKDRSAIRLPKRKPTTGENVYSFLLSLTHRLPRLRDAITGRINGDTLELGYQNYHLLPNRPLKEGYTISSLLGEGAFFLHPIPREKLGVVRLMAGSAYEIQRVDSKGDLHNTGVQVIVAGLGSISTGILVYSARTVYLEEAKVVGRVPRDTAALAQRMIEDLDEFGIVLAPNVTVSVIISQLNEAKLTTEEMMDILFQLDRAGRLGEFLNLIRFHEFRQFLKQKGVPWNYIFDNWEPSISDSLDVFAGVMIGAAGNVVGGIIETLRLVGIIIGAPFSEDLAKKRDEFYEGIKKFFEHPLTNLLRGLKQVYDSFVEKLWNLEFFDAGIILGNVIVTVLTLPEVVLSLPKLAGATAKIVIQLVRLTISEIKALGVSLSALVEFIRQPVPRLVTPEGFVFMDAAEDVVVIDKAGKPAGQISKSVIAEGEEGGALQGKVAEEKAPGEAEEEYLPVAERSQETFRKVYKQLEDAGHKPAGPGNGIRPNPVRYPTVEIRPNGDAFGTYSDLKQYLNELGITAKRGAGSTFEAHHLLEDEWMLQFGIQRDDGICVALVDDEHAHFSAEVPRELPRGIFADIDTIFEKHAKVYSEAGHKEWIEEMREFLRQNRNQIKSRYDQGLIPGANKPDFAQVKDRVFHFLDNL